MQLTYSIASAEVARVQGFFATWKDTPMVAARARRNVQGDRPPLSEERVWYALVTCQLTTQQRSGPDAPISKLMRLRPFPLALSEARSQPDIVKWAVAVLQGHGGIRRYNQIAEEMGKNLALLESGGWRPLLDQLAGISEPHSPERERTVARELDRMLSGVGPKQARNVLQSLGLTQYETPLDSRVTKWLQQFEFPVPLSAAALADAGYYEFVMDGFQELAKAAGILPCLLDAAIFASYDPAWTEESLIW